jgi:hypothetical protein
VGNYPEFWFLTQSQSRSESKAPSLGRSKPSF